MRTFRTGMAAALAALVVCAPGTAHGHPFLPNAFERHAAPAATSTRTAKLQQIVRNLVKAGAPGALVLVRTPTGVRSAASGFERLDPRVPMRVADRYRVASVTKTFIATVVLELEAQYRLKIDDPVERWLPGLVPNGTSITLRELLNHTSGLYSYTDDEPFIGAVISDPGRQWTPRELLSVAFAHPALFPPGTNWSYSNTNYVLLGLVIEAVTGRTVEQVLQDRIFGPQALAATSFPAGISVDGRFIHGYVGGTPEFPTPGGGLLDITPLLGPTWAWAAGGIVSNAADVTKFFSVLLKGQLLPAAQLAEMKTASAATGTYGLGLRLTYTKCGRAVGHDGDFPGYRNIVWATPNGRRVAVVMVNIDDSRVPWIRLEAAAGLALCSG